MAGRGETIKLSAQERQFVRYAVRSHPDVLSQVRKLSDISALDKRSLLQVAEALGIDIDAAKSGTLWDNHPKWDSEEGRELMRRSAEKPAFSGAIEEPMTFVVGGVAITRTLRVSYELTPEWSYVDPETGAETKGWEQSTTTYELSVHRDITSIQSGGQGKSRQRRSKEVWVNCTELFAHDVLGQQFDDLIDDRIDEACLRENKARKEAFSAGGGRA